MEKFKEPRDIKREYIDSLPPDELEDLLAHLNNRFNETLEPSCSKSRMDLLHIESLIRITKANIEAIAILDEVGRRR